MQKHTIRNTHIIILITAVISALMLFLGTKMKFDTGETERITDLLPAAGIVSGAAVQFAGSCISRHKDRKQQ